MHRVTVLEFIVRISGSGRHCPLNIFLPFVSLPSAGFFYYDLSGIDFCSSLFFPPPFFIIFTFGCSMLVPWFPLLDSPFLPPPPSPPPVRQYIFLTEPPKR